MVNAPTLDPAAGAVVEVDAFSNTCAIEGCGGTVVRHSLGGGQSVHRCTRCFRRYQRRIAAPQDTRQNAFRRFLNDFVTWRE